MATTEFVYDGARKAGVTIIALVALSSLLAIIYLFAIRRPAARTFKSTHLFGYFMCLLVANVIQGIGTIIDLEWVSRGRVVEGFSCTLQGALKQSGNLGASFWSLIISVHIFLLVFLKIRSNQATFIGIIIATWIVILLIPLIGRFVLQSAELGPYFGIAGEWCWVTRNYQNERIFLECVFTLVTIGISFILYSAIILRIRGKLVKQKNTTWRLNFFSKNNVEGATSNNNYAENNRGMLKIAKNMIWYPISYAVIMTPMTIIRIVELKYDSVPFAWTAISGIVFNSFGLINVILLLYIARAFNQLEVLPQVSPNRMVKVTLERTVSRDSVLGERRGSTESSEWRLKDKNDLLDSTPDVVKVDLPTKPAGTYVAPDSWKTGSAGGKKY
ncbi:hypothetical protein BDN70DRAFT_870320 [Pholiota conissans]|uniref:G-protein coupled receptors family 2 profile 2 domain-containing protein n=1 Tax=Pholiota conissans TaxID=109636 RepID=A0A9P6D823_9AGAR|nr:hypothetical protein BDN70DRAFT_870320 [Pholiota conissans]